MVFSIGGTGVSPVFALHRRDACATKPLAQLPLFASRCGFLPSRLQPVHVVRGSNPPTRSSLRSRTAPSRSATGRCSPPDVFSGIFRGSFRREELLRIAVEVGVASVGVVALTGPFIGMVLAVQAYSQFHTIGPGNLARCGNSHVGGPRTWAGACRGHARRPRRFGDGRGTRHHARHRTARRARVPRRRSGEVPRGARA